jgi:Zn-dependent protease with chaperone function
MTAIKANYSDGLSARSIPALLSVDAARLRIHNQDTGALLASWPLDTVSASSSYAVQTVLLSSVGGASELQMPTSDFIARIRPYLKRHSWAEKFTGVERRNRKLIALSTVCVAVIVLLVFGLRLATHRVARMVPLAAEKRLFAGLAYDLPGMVVCSAPETDIALHDLSLELSKKSERTFMPIEIHVIRTPMPNAFAFLGGRIYFTSGFLEQAGSVDEIAGVLAHEMEHIAQRHVLMHVLDSYGYAAILGPLAGGKEFNPAMLAGLLQLKYSRADEASADAGAGMRVDRAGYSRRGMAEFFERIEGKELKTPAVLEFLSSHPATKERIAAFTKGAKPRVGKPSAKHARLLKTLKKACN